jgi:predicted nucleic acid-binding protein
MKYMLDTNVLMHFANDKWKRGKIEKHLDRIGRENIFASSITIHDKKGSSFLVFQQVAFMPPVFQLVGR